MNIFSEILLLSSLISIICAILGARRKKTRGGLYFSLLMVASAIYSFGYAFQLETKSLQEIILWTKIQYLGIPFIPYFWFLFAVYFSGYRKMISLKKNLLLSIIPIITIAVVMTMEKHSLYYISYTTFENIPLGVIEIERGIWYWVYQIFSYSLIISGVALFTGLFYKTARPYRQQAALVLAGSFLPLLAYTIYLLGYSPYSIDLIPFAISTSGAIYLYALTHTGFLKLIPISRDVVFENMNGAVFVFDKNNNLVDFNPKAKNDFKFLEEEQVGQHIRDVFYNYNQIIEIIVHLDKNITGLNINLQGRTYSAMISALTDDNNKMNGKLMILNDITDLVEIENKLIENSKYLKEVIADKDKFFSIVAHDLRGPFQGFLGLSGILANEIDTLSKDEIQDLSSELNKSLVTQYNFLEELLQWAGLNTNRIALNPVELNLMETANAVVEVLKNNAVAKNITIEVTGQKEISLKADKDMIKLVIRNLLSNALKFSHSGGKIRVKTDEEEGFALLEIQDEGVGIPQANLGKIFSTGSHITTEGTAKERGSGLGLILCKEIVEKHNGRIWAESEIGKGSIFKVKLPLPESK